MSNTHGNTPAPSVDVPRLVRLVAVDPWEVRACINNLMLAFGSLDDGSVRARQRILYALHNLFAITHQGSIDVPEKSRLEEFLRKHVPDFDRSDPYSQIPSDPASRLPFPQLEWIGPECIELALTCLAHQCRPTLRHRGSEAFLDRTRRLILRLLVGAISYLLPNVYVDSGL